MQQVFSNLPTRAETHVWEISGNPVSPVGVNQNAPCFRNLCHPGDLSATFFADFSLCCNSIKFSPGFLTWFFTKFSPGFLNGFSLGVHQVLTGFS